MATLHICFHFSALAEAPLLLAIQLNRYHSDVSSKTHHSFKDEAEVILDPHFAIPCFRHDHRHPATALATLCALATFCSVLTHQGSVPTTGHYRALLAPRDFSAEPHLYCDDGKVAESLTGELPGHILQSGYLFLYCRIMQLSSDC